MERDVQLGTNTGHLSEHRHFILLSTTINISEIKIKRIEEPNGDYDDGNVTAITRTTITTITNPAPAAFIRGAPQFVDLFAKTEKGPFQGQHS
jgi:hypothetical protein